MNYRLIILKSELKITGLNSSNLVGFEVLTAVSTKMAVFWYVNFYQTTRCYNPEDSSNLFKKSGRVSKREFNIMGH
jgi:hypothetical protein